MRYLPNGKGTFALLQTMIAYLSLVWLFLGQGIASAGTKTVKNASEQTETAFLQNKINKGFNITDINKEFCLLYGEVSEAYDAYRKNKDDLGEELADIAIYLLGISEILGKNLEEEIINKIEINKNRKYKNVNGTMIKEKNQ